MTKRTQTVGGRQSRPTSPKGSAAQDAEPAWEMNRIDSVDAAVRERQLARAASYQLANQQSGYGLKVTLPDGSAFWSRGFFTCEFGCRQPLDNWSAPMFYSERRRGGIMIRRWSCLPPEEEA